MKNSTGALSVSRAEVAKRLKKAPLGSKCNLHRGIAADDEERNTHLRMTFSMRTRL